MFKFDAATANWLALLGLTGASFALAGYGLSGPALLWPVLIVVLLKGRIVIDHFMGLRGVAGPWRALVLGWLLLLVALIGYAFTLSFSAA